MASTQKSKYLTQKEIQEIMRPYAYKAMKDLAEESHRVIDEFYRDYKPDIYTRTFGMRNLFMPKLYKIVNGYRVEFTYSSDFLTTEHRDDEAVFEGSFVHGWHGGKYAWGHIKDHVKRMWPSPWRQINIFVDKYKL